MKHTDAVITSFFVVFCGFLIFGVQVFVANFFPLVIKLTIEEIALRQKSRVQWLQVGDSNHAYFHASMKHRYSRNRITTMYDEQGNFLTEPHQVEAEIHRFYKGLLGTSAKELDGVDLTTMKLGPQLSGEARALLCAPITVPDIEAALKDIDDSKAPVGFILCSSNLPGL